MKHSHLAVNLLKGACRLAVVIACVVSLSLGWQGIFTFATPAAMAASNDVQLIAGGMDMVEYERQNAQKQIDSAFGSGSSDQLGGQIEQTYGSAQRQFGKASGQVEGAAKQAEGRAKQDIGRAKSAIEQAGSEAQDQGESLIDNVKDFFGN
jgi:uncharacterized protein YjbJ (UPF0337 family)